MLHCLACDTIVAPWEEYCADCREAINAVYVEDSKWATFLKGVYPSKIPADFILHPPTVWIIDNAT